jgi:hypothetical protein
MRVSLALTRTAIGLAQGLALYLLYNSHSAGWWPANDGTIFAPLLLVSVFSPIVAVAGLDSLRVRSLAIWALLATAIVVGLATYDIIREPTSASSSGDVPRNIPSFTLWFAIAAGLFIAHALIVSGDADRKFIAGYARYFDVAWKQGVQIVLIGIFVGVFWALLYLGAALFKLININFFTELIQKPWFAMPATTLAIACAIHLTDVRTDIVRGVRTLSLTLLSWLLPMMAAIVVAFLATLVFTGLEPLWNTRRATTVLLAAAAALILLINAAYQDGAPERPVARILRYAGLATAGALTILVAIAAYAVVLRIAQYGWTPERIIAVACIVVAACYALGYALAVAAIRPWLKGIEVTNIFTAFVILGVMLALFSPIADPARISAADQVAGLESGNVSPDKFDFAFLRFRSGKFGQEALKRLRTKRDGPDAVVIAEKANAVLAAKSASEFAQQGDRATPRERAANIAVIFPKGEALPEGFLQRDWNATPQPGRFPRCLTARTRANCEAVMLDIDRDGKAEILLFSRPMALAFKEANGTWNLLGNIENADCKGVIEALREGKFEFMAPEANELKVAGQRLHVRSDCK